MLEREWPEFTTRGEVNIKPDDLAGAFETFGRWVNLTGKEKGFWDPEVDLDGDKFAKMHGEISEAFEALRHGNPPSDKLPGYSRIEEELADVIILILDWGHQRGLDIGAAAISKAFFNEGRPFRNGKRL